MLTDEILLLLGAAAGGVLLGLFYYLGLWFTLKRLSASPRPALLVLISFLFRLAVTLVGLYWITGGEGLRLIVALLGLLLARFITVPRLGPAPPRQEP